MGGGGGASEREREREGGRGREGERERERERERESFLTIPRRPNTNHPLQTNMSIEENSVHIVMPGGGLALSYRRLVLLTWKLLRLCLRVLERQDSVTDMEENSRGTYSHVQWVKKDIGKLHVRPNHKQRQKHIINHRRLKLDSKDDASLPM